MSQSTVPLWTVFQVSLKMQGLTTPANHNGEKEQLARSLQPGPVLQNLGQPAVVAAEEGMVDAGMSELTEHAVCEENSTWFQTGPIMEPEETQTLGRQFTVE